MNPAFDDLAKECGKRAVKYARDLMRECGTGVLVCEGDQVTVNARTTPRAAAEQVGNDRIG